MKRVGKGIYDIPGGSYYRAREQRVESPAHLIVNLPECVEPLHRWNDKPAIKGSPEHIREFAMLLIEAAAHADAAERYGTALDAGLTDCERIVTEAKS